jgi:hypothetical protein
MAKILNDWYGYGEEMMFKTYHFDKWRKDKEGDFFKVVGQFSADFTDEIEIARASKLKAGAYNKQNYGHAANPASTVDGVYHAVEDADNPDGDPTAEMFHLYKYEEDERLVKFRAVAEWFELDKDKKYTWKFHDQKPNQQLMVHIDNLPGEPRKDRVIDNPEFKYAKDKVRFLVFLNDWEPGQLFQFGNYMHTQWRAGDIVTWEWSTLPHATWNGSWKKRPALQITGTATENTWKKIKEGSRDNLILI